MNDKAHDNDSPTRQLALGFASHVEQWARKLQGIDAGSRPGLNLATVKQAAFELSLATSDGHVCLSLADLTRVLTPSPSIATLRADLLASGLIGTPQAVGAMPMILDDQDRLYLHRYFDYERRLAQRLMRASSSEPVMVDLATREQLSALFQQPADAPPRIAANTALNTAPNTASKAAPQAPKQSSEQVDWLTDSQVDDQPPEIGATQGPPDWQRVATALALRQRLTVISGGPGTGKTTTVVNLLACLIAQQPDCRIALAAPTGKAAARMTEAIRSRSAHLPPAIRDRLPADSFTIHRLLGVRPDGFIHHAGNRLAIDALVVDEASMLDLALATQLLEAVPETARIILLGDKDQLSAVEAGAVFSDLSADPTLSDDCRNDIAQLCGIDEAQIVPPAAIRASALRDTATWLSRNFRFAADSSIARLAGDINGARSKQAIDSLKRSTGSSGSNRAVGNGGGGNSDGSVRWLDDGATMPAQASLDRMLQGYEPYLEAVRRDPQDASAITEAFGKFRVLCAVHEGPRGVVSLNERVTRHAREALNELPRAQRTDPRDPWYAGRPVMVLRNDHVLKLFNGDIGISLPNEQGDLMVYFADATGGLRAVAPVRLPVHQTAFAMTVHKSQGSEFDEVLVLLPAQRSRVVSRELLYTAVTRARHRVSICASAEVVTAAIQSPTSRQAGLLDRLREAGLERQEHPPRSRQRTGD